jgi:4-amino-4-deoxy-L-arabinose transferase-like glycosyltransferase
VIWGLLALGVSLRLRMYLANRSLWLDESFVALNVIDRDLAGLARPLDYELTAPLAFLWAERLAINVFGTSEYALRALPLLAGILGLFVFWRLASRMLGAAGTIMAVAAFAVSDPLIRYATEAKQYSLDAAITVILWWVFTAAKARLDDDDPGAWALVGVLGSAAIWMSHPAVFVVGGLSICWSWLSLRRAAWKSLTLRAVIGLVWVANFVTIYIVSLRFASQTLQAYWRGAEAPLVPLSVQDLTRYIDVASLLSQLPLGHRVFQLVMFAAVVGAVALWRRKHRQWWWLATTLALVWLASGLGKYPLTERLWLFFAPAMILLVAAGVEEVWRRTRQPFPILAPILACLLLAYPLLAAAHTAVRPRGREEIRPLLQHLVAQYRAGDLLYLYRPAEFAVNYYAQRGLVFPGEVVIGMNSNERYQGEADVEMLRDRDRVWVLFSHVKDRSDGIDDEKLVLHLLDRVGVRLHAVRQTGASLYLYDLSRAP